MTITDINKFLILILVFIFSSCDSDTNEKDRLLESQRKKIDSLEKLIIKKDTVQQNNISDSKITLKSFYENNPAVNQKVNEIFDKMTDEERIGQMLVTSAGESGMATDYVIKLINDKAIGGIILMNGTKKYLNDLRLKFSEEAKKSNILPLIYSLDAEPSIINSRIKDIKKFPKTSSLKNEKEVINTANEISKVLLQLGINQNFAPVVDINLNKAVIKDRSFGNDIQKVNLLSSAFINATQNNNIVATAKHFPGHGNVKGDTHKELVYIEGEMKELSSFENAIKNGVISIMVGHIVVKTGEFNSAGLPASMSNTIVTKLLIEKLGFKGIIITDAMNMGAVNKLESPSMKAVEAGNDMILMPQGEKKLIDSIKKKMMTDAAFKDRIYTSVKKIIKLKICLGLI